MLGAGEGGGIIGALRLLGAIRLIELVFAAFRA